MVGIFNIGDTLVKDFRCDGDGEVSYDGKNWGSQINRANAQLADKGSDNGRISNPSGMRTPRTLLGGRPQRLDGLPRRVKFHFAYLQLR